MTSQKKVHLYGQLFLVWSLLFEVLPFLGFEPLRFELISLGDNTYLRIGAALIALLALIRISMKNYKGSILIVLVMSALYLRQLKFYFIDFRHFFSLPAYGDSEFRMFLIVLVYVFWLFTIYASAYVARIKKSEET